MTSTLDVSRSGNLSPHQTRALNAMADCIREDYVALVDEISRKSENSLDWFVTPFSARNTYVCPVFEDVVKAAFVCSVFDANDSSQFNRVIVDGPVLCDLLRTILPREIVVKSRQNRFMFYGSLLTSVCFGLFRHLIGSLWRIISFKFACFMHSSLRSLDLTKIKTIVETYVYQDSFAQGEFYDRHFCGLGKHLGYTSHESIAYFPVLYRVRNYYAVYKQAFYSSSSFVFTEDFISLYDVFYSLLHPCRLSYRQSDVYIKGMDVSSLVRYSLLRYSGHSSSLQAIVRYRCISKLLKCDQSLNNVLRWYENQEIDRGSIMAWRNQSLSLGITGYMGYFSSVNYLCAFPTDLEFELGLTPDRLGVMGECLIGSHKRFCSDLNVFVAPSFRFNFKSLSANIPCHHKSGGICIVVALPIFPAHIDIIIDVIQEISVINRNLCLDFILKLHPTCKMDLTDIFVDSNNVFYTFTNSPINELISSADFVLSTASSTLVEAVMYGVHAIVVSSSQTLSENVIPDCVPKSCWTEAYNARELLSLLSRNTDLHGLSDFELDQLQSHLVGKMPDANNVHDLIFDPHASLPLSETH